MLPTGRNSAAEVNEPGKKRERPDNIGAYRNFLRCILQEKANRYAKFSLSHEGSGASL